MEGKISDSPLQQEENHTMQQKQLNLCYQQVAFDELYRARKKLKQLRLCRTQEEQLS